MAFNILLLLISISRENMCCTRYQILYYIKSKDFDLCLSFFFLMDFSLISEIIISIVSLYVQNYAHKMLKRSYELISFAIITMVVLALSLTVWSNSFTSNLSDIVFRPCTSQELRNSDENWGRNTPFTSRRFFLNSRKQYYDTAEQISAPTDTLRIF